MKFSGYAITIEALDDDDSRLTSLEMAVSMRTGRAVVAGLHTHAYSPDVDARQPFDRLDVDALLEILPKVGTVYDHQAELDRLADAATSALVQRATVAELGPGDAVEVPVVRMPDPDREPPAQAADETPQPARTGQLSKTRSAALVASIADNLRGRIANGEYPPNRYLPHRAELQTMYPEASGHTIEMAIRKLQGEGILARGNRGGVAVLRRPTRRATSAAEPPERPGPQDGSRTSVGRSGRGPGAVRADLETIPVVERPINA